MNIKFSENDLIAKNAEFSDKCEFHYLSKTRQMAPVELLEFTNELISEEVKETQVATVFFKKQLEALKLGDTIGLDTMQEVVDGYCDTAVLSLNGIYKVGRITGLTHSQAVVFTKMCFDAVLESNLSKITESGEVLFREDGKVLKPDTYKKPDFTKAFEYVTLRLNELKGARYV